MFNYNGYYKMLRQLITTFITLFYELSIAWYREIIDFFLAKPKSIQNHVIVITGGAGAIGKEVGQLLANLGAKIVLLDLHKDTVEKAANEINENAGYAVAYECDITRPDQLKQVAAKIADRKDLGRVDIVICCAGILVPKSVLDLKPEDVRKSFDVNILGIFWTIQAFLPDMVKRNDGHLVAILSIAGHFGQSFSSAYSSSKFAIRGLMESLQWELLDMGKTGVKTTMLNPYFTQTPLLDNCSPSSRFFGIYPVDYTAGEIVKGILYEYEEMFIPNFMTLFCMLLKITSPGRVKAVWRKFFNVVYYTPEKSTTTNTTSSNNVAAVEKNEHTFMENGVKSD